MGYRKVSMIEIKEILLRIAKGQSKRGIRRDLSVHGLTINRYIQEAKCLGINPEEADPSQITDSLFLPLRQIRLQHPRQRPAQEILSYFP